MLITGSGGKGIDGMPADIDHLNILVSPVDTNNIDIIEFSERAKEAIPSCSSVLPQIAGKRMVLLLRFIKDNEELRSEIRDFLTGKFGKDIHIAICSEYANRKVTNKDSRRSL